MNQLQALEEEDGPAGTSKGNQLEHLSGPSMMMSLVTTSCSADEERSAGAKGPDKAAGALSIDDVISSDITISRKIYQQRASTSSWYLKLAIAKRCRLHKLIRQRFDFALKIQQMVCDDKTSSRKMMYQSRATVDPVASSSAIAYPVDMVSRRKKSRSSEAWQPGAKYPVDKETAVARSVVTKNKQQLSE
ncbi:hypothetical protein F511_14767 [Dorcoceras hygrometricum]|uniref:Uncharacterized protein n=1 Tax=Dorcoceras hygrometricum TaxID=472368 RepID=A0A2Z7BDS8_9LAMI|nr:hypothetical protein F511_14767 [Dorcoceras hygrometricum]